MLGKSSAVLVGDASGVCQHGLQVKWQASDRIYSNGVFFSQSERRWAEEIRSSATIERDRGERDNEAGGARWRQCTKVGSQLHPRGRMVME